MATEKGSFARRADASVVPPGIDPAARGNTVTVREPRIARPHHAAIEELERHRAFIAKLANPLWARFAEAS